MRCWLLQHEDPETFVCLLYNYVIFILVILVMT